MIRFDTSVRIERAMEAVFAYVADPANLPRWNSAVQAVRSSSPGVQDGLGATYAMQRALPGGRVTNDLEVVEHERPRAFAIRTFSGPTPFVYRFRFSSQDGATLIDLDAEVELGGAAGMFASLARRAVRRGVDENLGSLKAILEGAR